MGVKSFLSSDWKTKKNKLIKFYHSVKWRQEHKPTLSLKIKNEFRWLLDKKNTIIVSGWLVKFYKPNPDIMNWGDDLNIYLLERLTGKKVIALAAMLFPHKNYCCIGTLIPTFVNNKSVIWGSGGGYFNTPIRKVNRPANVLAVRGPLTRKFLLNNGIECPNVFGDPALLLPLFYKPKAFGKKYKLSLIPHHRDIDDINDLERLCKKYFPSAHIINVARYGEWTDVIDEIVNSEIVLSSSLHGLIVSDAYGVPNMFVEYLFHHAVTDKYEDYCASVNRSFCSPVPINRVTEKDISDCLNLYEKISFDTNKLLKSCPFKLKKDLNS